MHVAGAGSLAGWVALAVASHRMERPLPLFLGVMAWEWSMLLVVWRVLARGDGKPAFRQVLAWAAAFLLCGLTATPVMEDDHFRFLWDGRQSARAADLLEACGVGAIRLRCACSCKRLNCSSCS